MQELSKTHFIQSQFLIILGLLEHTKDNIEGTEFEDDNLVEKVLDILIDGSKLLGSRMAELVKQGDDDCRSCCY